MSKGPLESIQDLNKKGFKELESVVARRRTSRRTVFSSTQYTKALQQLFDTVEQLEIRSAPQPGELNKLAIPALRYASCSFEQLIRVSQSGFCSLWVADADLVDTLAESAHEAIQLSDAQIAQYLRSTESAWTELKRRSDLSRFQEEANLLDRLIRVVNSKDPGIGLPMAFSLLERLVDALLLKEHVYSDDEYQSRIWPRANRLRNQISLDSINTPVRRLRLGLLSLVILRLYANDEWAGTPGGQMNRNRVVHRIAEHQLTKENVTLVTGAIVASMWVLYA